MQAEIEAHEAKENKSIIKLNPGQPLYGKYDDKMSKLGAVLKEEFFRKETMVAFEADTGELMTQ